MTDYDLRIRWLSRYISAKQAAQDAQEAFQIVQCDLTRTTACLSGMPFAHSPRDKMADGIAQLASARRRAALQSMKARCTKEQVSQCICSSNLSPQYKTFLLQMYCSGKTQNEAAHAVGKSSAGGTFMDRRAGMALSMPPGWHEQL